MKKKNGFTLIEILVVLIIMAILAAVAVPALIGYMEDSKERQAITQCRQVVIASQSVASKYFTKDTFTPSKIFDKSSDILTLAKCDGSIVSMTFSTNIKVTKLNYLTVDGVNVVFDSAKDPQYYIGTGAIENAPGAMNLTNNVYAQNKDALDLLKSKNGVDATKELQALVKEMNGAFTDLSSDEKEILCAGNNGSANANLKLTWKPVISSNGTIFLMATPKSSDDSVSSWNGQLTVSRMASMIYYNNCYYYHSNGYGNIDSSHVPDGTFDIDLLNNAPLQSNPKLAKPTGWYRYE